MAIIGKLTQLDWFFKAYPMLKEAKDYMLNATNPTHSIHKRIMELDLAGQERKEVSYALSQGVRAIEQTYHLKEAKNAFFETHRAFIDFQLVVEGYEYMCIGDRSAFDVKIPYDESRDLIVYDNALPYSLYSHYKALHIETSNHKTTLPKVCRPFPIDESLNTPCRSNILLTSGDLAVFFPNDVHAGGLELTPNINHNVMSQVKKSVLKVPVSLLGL